MLSHGDDRDIIYGSDQALTISALTEPFKRSTNSLLGKPKIFIFQVNKTNSNLYFSIFQFLGMSWSKSNDITSKITYER
jgi:hypothetical protein